MIEKALVTEAKGSFAKVKINKREECAKCGMCMFPKNAGYAVLNAKNDIGAKQGDVVRIETNPKAKTLGVFLVFGVPLILILVSALIGYFVIQKEIWIVILSLISFVSWYTILAVIDKKLQKSVTYYSVITAIVKTGENDEFNKGNN